MWPGEVKNVRLSVRLTNTASELLAAAATRCNTSREEIVEMLIRHSAKLMQAGK
jgi:uncharacterized protein (DUF1778 family)